MAEPSIAEQLQANVVRAARWLSGSRRRHSTAYDLDQAMRELDTAVRALADHEELLRVQANPLARLGG